LGASAFPILNLGRAQEDMRAMTEPVAVRIFSDYV
jgi:hypothetical protein